MMEMAKIREQMEDEQAQHMEQHQKYMDKSKGTKSTRH
jgi:hypothetical protein